MQQQCCIIELGRPLLDLLWSITLAQCFGACRGYKAVLCFRLCLFDESYHFARCRKLLYANLGLLPDIHDKIRGMLMVLFLFFQVSFLFIHWKNWNTSFSLSLHESLNSKDTMLLLIQGPFYTKFRLSTLFSSGARRLIHPSGSLC